MGGSILKLIVIEGCILSLQNHNHKPLFFQLFCDFYDAMMIIMYFVARSKNTMENFLSHSEDVSDLKK